MMRRCRVPAFLLMLVLLVSLSGAGIGVASATDTGQTSPPCPGDENPNVGLVNANETGILSSQFGIETAFTALGCPPLE